MPGKVRGGSVTPSGTPCSRSRRNSSMFRATLCKMSRKKGWPSAGRPVSGARISLMSSSKSSGKGCDPSPNESDSWSLSAHGEVRIQVLAPSTAALDSGRAHGANRPNEGFPPPSLKGRCLKAIWRYMTLSEILGS